MKKPVTVVYCVGSASKDGTHEFYLQVGSDRYFLFRQDYRKGVQEYFGDGVRISQAIHYRNTKGKRTSSHDTAIQRTLSKLPCYIRYIEKEYGIAVLDKTIKKQKV